MLHDDEDLYTKWCNCDLTLEATCLTWSFKWLCNTLYDIFLS